MITFFRKLRHHWLSQDKFNRYIMYAIGEIILVVIGILIALQINLWNENRKVRDSEQALLKDLKVEINANIAELQTIISKHEEALAANNTLINAILTYQAKTRAQDSILYIGPLNAHAQNFTYDPKLGTLKSIINSGKIDYISNTTLKYKLSALMDFIVDVNESTNQIQSDRSTIFFTHINKYVFSDGNVIDFNYEDLFESSEFRFWLVHVRTLRMEGLEEEMLLMTELETIKTILESEIKI